MKEGRSNVKEKSNPAPEPHEFHWTMDGIRREAEPKPTVRPIPKDPVEEDLSKDAENRRYHRIDLTVPILYKILPEEPLVASHAAVPSKSGAAGGNISPTGACLVLAEKLARGTVLALSLHGLEGGSVSAVGKVVWSKPTETAHHYLTGLEFVVVYRKTRSKTEYLNTDILKSLLGPA